jgi:hypothetical protein
MGIRSFLAKPFAAYIDSQTRQWSLQPGKYQLQTLLDLIAQSKSTAFGKDHDFASIRTYEDFKKRVPVRDYELLKPYFDRVVKGEADVLWKDKPL